jgi:hypothetical protein
MVKRRFYRERRLTMAAEVLLEGGWSANFVFSHDSAGADAWPSVVA